MYVAVQQLVKVSEVSLARVRSAISTSMSVALSEIIGERGR